MSRKIAVIGIGYVGLVVAVGLADFGNTVMAADTDGSKIRKLKRGITSIYETGVHEYLKRNIEAGRLLFTQSVGDAIRFAEVVFIAVGTPSTQNGDADLSAIISVLEIIARNLDSHKIIVTKSTVPVGTNKWMEQELSRMTGSTNFEVVSNPEFVREGRALQDFFHPDRVVIGVESENAKSVLSEIYRPLYLIQTPFIWCSRETAELTKYASNAYLATKVTFINQIANLAEVVGADIHVVAQAMGKDGRIGPKFLHPGPGYGGSCLPKDTRALALIGDKLGVDMSLIKNVIMANEEQKASIVRKLERLAGDLNGKVVAVFGLAFKAETDDVRESPSITIVRELLQRGAKVHAHDPKAVKNFQKEFPIGVDFFDDEFSAVQDADALLLCTEWNSYRNIDLRRVRELVRGKIILDVRNVLDPKCVVEEGFVYEGVGRVPPQGDRSICH
jgi:UDPglucose 6-dehydrogenase